MILRKFKLEDSAVISKWIKTEEELYKWSADRFNKFPLDENDIKDNYLPQIESGRFIPLTMTDDAGNAVGHFIIRYPQNDNDETVRFGFVIVNPELRGKGYGRKMIELGKEYVRENLSAARIDLGVFENNISAKRCYEAAGFQEYSRRKCLLPPGEWECIDMEINMNRCSEKMIYKASAKQFDTVREITHKTINEIYPKYYPTGAVKFFIVHHNDNNILTDINNGNVYLLNVDDKDVGTVTVKDNEILRLFVLPQYQHKGFGRELLDFAEELISRNFCEILIDASLAAKKIYKLRGYIETEYNQIETKNGDILCYDIMKKTLKKFI